MLAWLPGPPLAVTDRLALEAVSARAALLGDVDHGPFPQGRRGELQILSGGAEVRIVLGGPVASAASLADLRSLWNGAPDYNGSFLSKAYDLAVSEALRVLARSDNTGFAPAAADGDGEAAEVRDEEPDQDDHNLQDVLDDLNSEDPEAGAQALVWNSRLGREVATVRPDLANVAGVIIADLWWRLQGEIEQMLTALAVLSAGAAARDAVEEAEALLVKGWKVFWQYQSERATSDWCLIGDRIAPLLQAWAMLDLGAFAFATILGAEGWSATPNQPVEGVSSTELVCRQLPAGVQPHRM